MINPLAVAVEGFGYSPLSISTLGWLTELEILPNAGVWYLPSDVRIRVGYERENVHQTTYKVWPLLHEKVVAQFYGIEPMAKSVKARLVEDKKAVVKTTIKVKDE